MIDLRPYQHDAIEQMRGLLRIGKKRILAVSPTGSGKTVIASEVIRGAIANGRNVLFNAHRIELIDQTYEKLLEFGVPENEISVIRAKDPRHRPRARVFVASAQTLVNRTPPPAQLVFDDEAHRVLSSTRQKIAGMYPNATFIGLTATPWRLDGRSLGDFYEALVVVARMDRLIREGYIVEPEVYSHPSHPDTSKVHVRGGDFVESELEELVDNEKFVGNIVEHWKERADGMRTVAFAVSVKHSMRIAAAFCAAGIPAEHLDGTTKESERKAILARLERGETRVVSNCAVLTEGWDMPCVKVAILARPTLSKTLYLQCAGRVLRPWEGMIAKILDHAGCAVRFDNPEAYRDYDLRDDGQSKKRVEDAIVPMKTCRECFRVVHANVRVCPSCGNVFEVEREEPIDAKGKLVRRKSYPVEVMRAKWDALSKIAIEKKYKPGWVYRKFIDAFGQKPPKSFIPPNSYEYSEEEKRKTFDDLKTKRREGGYKPGWVGLVFEKKFGHPAPSDWLMELQEREWLL